MSFFEFMKWLIEKDPDAFASVFIVASLIGLPAVVVMWHSMWDAIGRRK